VLAGRALVRRRKECDDDRADDRHEGADEHAGDDGAARAAPAQQGEGSAEHEPGKGAGESHPAPEAAAGGPGTSDTHQAPIRRSSDGRQSAVRRRTSVSLFAADTTAEACSRPG